LPRDPNTDKLNPGSSVFNCYTYGSYNCYLYQSDGVDYKVKANCTPEGVWPASDPFYDPTRPNNSWAVFTPGASAWAGG
jgi:hypothetical protein